MIVKWPGVVEGGRRIDVPSVTMDLYPTMLEMAGLPQAPEQHRDGASLVPLLDGSGSLARPTLYWHFPHYHGSGNVPSGSIRVGDLKLVEWLEDGRVELYDLAADLREATDLAATMPETADELRAALHRWRSEVGAAMPTPNPDWRPR
jgi:arylsulfatase A-like enzyme